MSGQSEEKEKWIKEKLNDLIKGGERILESLGEDSPVKQGLQDVIEELEKCNEELKKRNGKRLPMNIDLTENKIFQKCHALLYRIVGAGYSGWFRSSGLEITPKMASWIADCFRWIIEALPPLPNKPFHYHLLEALATFSETLPLTVGR